MAIKVKNLAEFVISLSIPGTQSTSGYGSKGVGVPVPFDGVIKAVYAVLGTAGTTNTQTVDIKKNGSAISTSPFLSFATTATAPTYDTTDLSANPISVLAGDLLLAVNTAVHTTPAVDCQIAVVIQRKKEAGTVPAMVTGTYGGEVA